MDDLIIRPTGKFIRLAFLVSAAVFLAVEVLYLAYWKSLAGLSWLPLTAPVVFLWPLSRALRRQCVKTVVSGGRLRCENGVGARTTRTIQLAKLQDVRVDQSISQRMWDVGDLSIETAGETSRLTIANVDAPRQLADEIMNRAQRAASA